MPPKKQQSKNGFREFNTMLKTDSLPGVLLLSGPEQFLTDWAVRAVKERYVSEAALSLDRQILDSCTVQEILEACETMSMFSEKRLVLVRDFLPVTKGKPALTDDEKEKLIRYAKAPNERTVLVFTAESFDGRSSIVKELKKSAAFFEFDALDEREFAAFAMKRISAAGLSISRSDMNILIQETGYFNKESDYRLYNFDNDLRKLISLSEGGRIRTEDIRAAIAGDRDTFIFDLLDGISGNDKRAAFRILENRLTESGRDVMPLIGSIVSQMELLLTVKEISMDPAYGMSAARIAKYTGLNEFRVKKALRYVSSMGEQKIRDLLSDAYGINRDIIGGLIEPALALELFVAKI